MLLNKDHSDSFLFLKNFLIGNVNFEFLGFSKLNLIDSGFYHLFVISGFHVGIIFLITNKFFSILFLALNLNFKTRYLINFSSLIFCLFYIYLCNFPISGIRALSLITIYQIVINYKRVPRSLNCLFAVFLIIILVNFKVTDNPGFWYSFCNSAALIYFFRNFDNHNSLINNITKLWRSSLICFYASTPICIYFFNKLQLAGIFSNVIAIPSFIFITFPLSILAFITNNPLLNKLAVTNHYYLMNFAKFCSNFKFLTFNNLNIDKTELLIITLTCLICISARLKYHLIGIVIIIITSLNFIKNNHNYLLINSIPRSIDINFNGIKQNILKKSTFNKNLSCLENQCIVPIDDIKILILKEKLSFSNFHENCKNFDIVINLNNNNFSCYITPTITAYDIFFNKKITIYLINNHFYINY